MRLKALEKSLTTSLDFDLICMSKLIWSKNLATKLFHDSCESDNMELVYRCHAVDQKKILVQNLETLCMIKAPSFFVQHIQNASRMSRLLNRMRQIFIFIIHTIIGFFTMNIAPVIRKGRQLHHPSLFCMKRNLLGFSTLEPFGQGYFHHKNDEGVFLQ